MNFVKKKILLCIKEMRMNQWVKNLLVFAPLLFDRKLLNANLLLDSILAFFSFSLISSSIYVINDICDVEEDRKHPKKKHRPIAAGKISIFQAKILSSLLILLSLTIAYLVNWYFIVVLLIYVATNILYSLKLKQIPIVDILLVALMYLMRVYSGAFAISVEVSNWLLLTTLFAALFIITAKRKSEFVNGKGAETRSVLKYYDPRSMDHFLIIGATSTLLSYALYTFTHEKIFVWSIIFVLFAIFRYSLLIFHDEYDVEEPEIIFVKDKQLLSSIILWGMFVTSVLYF
ncbi:MAG: decaprenyl-phosphate phosphoribosyltransferase [Candidatus Magasanikbacteria bacterium]